MSDDDVAPVTNSDIDLLWNSLRSGSDDDAPRGRKRPPSESLIGVRAGESSFEVDKIRRMARDDEIRVPREDGEWTPKRRDPDEGGGFYGPAWREEEISREAMLLDDPNYIFLTLVAGAANAPVEKLYNEDSIGRKFRLRLQERQAVRSMEEARVDVDGLRVEHDKHANEQSRSRQLLAQLRERERGDSIFDPGDKHRDATRTYIEQSLINRKQRDIGALFENVKPTGPAVPAADMDLLSRLIDDFDDRRSAETQSMQVGVLAEILFWDASTGAVTFVYKYATLTDMFKRVLAGRAERRRAPRIIQRALARLATLVTLDEVRNPDPAAADDAIETAFKTFWDDYRRDRTIIAMDNLVGTIDDDFTKEARFFARRRAVDLWLGEARALYDMLRTGINLLKVRSVLAAPTLEARAPEPNRIMDIRSSLINSFSNSVDAVGAMVDAGRQADGPNALLLTGVLGSNAFKEDLALLALFEQQQVDRSSDEAVLPVTKWASAMAWYEWIGGSLFREDGVNTQFPADETLRSSVTYGVKDVPSFSLGINPRPPAHFSLHMRGLWARHIPEWRLALNKFDKRQILSDVESIVYDEMSGGVAVPPVSVLDKIWRRGPVLVFSIRLYRTELAVARYHLVEEIDRRQTLIDSISDRMAKMLRGETVDRPAPKLPYEHRRGWVEQPEHSGIVRMTPIVTKAIGSAWSRLQRLVPKITDVVDIEFAQRDPQMREDFAELVALEMALVTMRFQKQYTQLGLRAQIDRDITNVINRFRRNYDLTATGVGRVQKPGPTAAPGASWVAKQRPTVPRPDLLLL